MQIKIREKTIHPLKDAIVNEVLVIEEFKGKFFKDITNLKFNVKLAKKFGHFAIMILNGTIKTKKEKKQTLPRKKKEKEKKMFVFLYQQSRDL